MCNFDIPFPMNCCEDIIWDSALTATVMKPGRCLIVLSFERSALWLLLAQDSLFERRRFCHLGFRNKPPVRFLPYYFCHQRQSIKFICSNWSSIILQVLRFSVNITDFRADERGNKRARVSMSVSCLWSFDTKLSFHSDWWTHGTSVP